MKFIPPTKDEWAFFLLLCKNKTYHLSYDSKNTEKCIEILDLKYSDHREYVIGIINVMGGSDISSPCETTISFKCTKETQATFNLLEKYFKDFFNFHLSQVHLDTEQVLQEKTSTNYESKIDEVIEKVKGNRDDFSRIITEFNPQ